MRYPIAALVFPVALLGCGVRGVDQETDALLGQYTSDKASELQGGAAKSETLMVGNKDAYELVPVLLEWEVAKDANGCLRIKKATATRAGGPTSAEVYDLKFTVDGRRECASRLNGSDEKFESMQVSYCWRWNGAVNSSKCAYSSGVTLNADAVGVEGRDKAAAPGSAAK